MSVSVPVLLLSVGVPVLAVLFQVFFGTGIFIQKGKHDNCPSLIGYHELFPLLIDDGQETGLNDDSNCSIQWHNKDHIRDKFRDRIQKGEKQIFRLRVPVVLGGTAHHVTVVWVTAENQYLLFFPQNFQTLSLGTTVIISENLRHNHISYTCPVNCSRCGLGRRELAELLSELTANETQYKWKYLCIPDSYGTEDILDEYPESSSDLYSLNSRYLTLPDLLYYFYFFKTFFVRRPFLGIPAYKEDFPNYYCYDNTGQCVVKEFLMKYYILVYTAVGVWLYCPLLVYYLPSSESVKRGGGGGGKRMLPTHKSPVYYTHCIQCMLGYHLTESSEGAWWKIRLRRFLFLILFFSVSFRLFILSQFRLFSWALLLLMSIGILIPLHISKSIQTEKPHCFPLFPDSPYPEGMIKWSEAKDRSIEFQRLAYVMQERIWLAVHCKFWKFIVTNSFSSFIDCMKGSGMINVIFICISFLHGAVILLAAFLIVVTHFLVPILFFTKEMLIGIIVGSKDYYNDKHRTTFSFLASAFHCLVMSLFLLYGLIVMLALSQFLNEVAMFTYIGAILTPTMALKYVVLASAVVTMVVTMVRELHKSYDEILKVTKNVLEEEKSRESLDKEAKDKNLNLNLKKDDKGVHVFKEGSATPHCSLLEFDTYSSLVSKELFDYIVEQYQPLKRQIILIVIKLLLTIYFIGIAMWIKNVFHIERKVKDIFSLASHFAVIFLPSLIEFLSYRGKFGKNAEILRKREVYSVTVGYLEFLSSKI